MDELLRCCCGSQDCAFLTHNSTILEGVEHNLAKAAVLGQALLVRHEAYVAESGRERLQMVATIEELEKEKRDLEQRNVETIKANRDLLDQLEQLNEAITSSEAHAQVLSDTLRSTEEEMERLAVLAARTESLEQQLMDLEREQLTLQGAMETKVGDERTAIQRWKRAEKTIGDLQDQMDRIEMEGREERERHVEIVSRMERRMAVEKELATASDRPKAKAGQETGSTSVVSHFVKDILLDNSNLQHGILELREMLSNSNDEVEHLREQLQFHQPLSPIRQDPPPIALSKELAGESVLEPVLNKGLHIHHHYHAPAPKKEPAKPPINRRPKKKRYSLTPSRFASPISPDSSTSATILAQTAVTVPNTNHTNRWSNATTLAPSSCPGSPFSMSHRGSIYDRVFSDVAYDSSRPTSPSDSVGLASPMFKPAQYQQRMAVHDDVFRPKTRKSQSLKPPSLSTIRSSSPISLTAKSSPATAIISAASPQNSLANDMFMLSPSLHASIPEESENVSSPETQFLVLPSFSHDFDFDEALSPTTARGPRLRRAASHESLISVSGMDIHTLQSRPSQLLFSTSPHLASPSSGTSSEPVLTPWTATATSSMSRRELDSSALNRSLLYGPLVNQKRGIDTSLKKQPSGNILAKKVGGWVFGKWGETPTPSSPRPESSSSAQSAQTIRGTPETNLDIPSQTPTTAKKTPMKVNNFPVRLRPSGINQSGPIWGFFDIPPTPTQTEVTDLDVDALNEALADS